MNKTFSNWWKAFDFEAFKLDDILDATAKLLAQMTGYTAVIQDVEPTRQRLTGFEIVPLSNHDALAVLTLDESKPVTSVCHSKNFLTSDLKSSISWFKSVHWKYGLGYPLPPADRDSTDCTALFQDDRQCAGSLWLRLLATVSELDLCRRERFHP